MNLNPMTSKLEVRLQPDAEPSQDIKLLLSNPANLDEAEIVLHFDEDNYCLIEFQETDFPDHFHFNTPLRLEIATATHSLHVENDLAMTPGESLKLEIPVTMPNVADLLPSAPVFREEARYLISRALSEFTNVEDAEVVDVWISEQMGNLEMLDALADSVIKGQFEAVEQMEMQLLAGDEEAEDPVAFANQLAEVIGEVENSGIFNTLVPSPEEYWSANILEGERISKIIRAAYMTGRIHSEAQAMVNVSLIMRKLQPVIQVQMAYDAAILAYNGEPRQIRSVPETKGFPNPRLGRWPRIPGGPDDGPVIPKGLFKPQVWPPRTPNDTPRPLGGPLKKKFWVVERFFCTLSVLKQLPFPLPPTYSISSVSTNGMVCLGEMVIISGTGFENSGKLFLTTPNGKREVPVNIWSSTNIEFNVPSWASSGKLHLQITFTTREICGVTRPFYKIGSPAFLKVLDLEAKMQIQRTGGNTTAPTSSARLFNISQQGQPIRQDSSKVVWNTKDALDGVTLTVKDPNMQSSNVSSLTKGSHVFPASASTPIEGIYEFTLNANNKCSNKVIHVNADYYIGTKAKITALTVDGNAGPVIVFNENDAAAITWNVVDETSLKLSIQNKGLNNAGSTAVFATPVTSWIAQNAFINLKAIGTIRDAQFAPLVTDYHQIRVAVVPKIVKFEATQTTVTYGDVVDFTFETKNATNIVLKRASGRSKNIKIENGSISIKMDNGKIFQETVTLELTNVMLPLSHSSRVIQQSITIKYLPSFERCVLKPEKASLTQFWDGGQTIDQTTAPSDNIKLCYNTSQGTNSIPTPQRFRPDFKLRNAMFPAILALKGSSRYWPVTPGSPVPPGFKPKIGDSFKLKVFIKNPNGIKSCSCDLTYYKGYLRYYFCIRRKAAPGSTGTPQGVRVPAEGWTKEEAKAKALKLLRVTESTHTIKEVGFKGSCL